MVVSTESLRSLKPGIPDMLFEHEYYSDDHPSHYDIHPDGDRFVMIKSIGAESGFNQINIVLNWFDVLKEKMAGAGE
jgi:hypothetical protein